MANDITVKHLEVRYKEKNIAEILDMTIEDAVSFRKYSENPT